MSPKGITLPPISNILDKDIPPPQHSVYQSPASLLSYSYGTRYYGGINNLAPPPAFGHQQIYPNYHPFDPYRQSYNQPKAFPPSPRSVDSTPRQGGSITPKSENSRLLASPKLASSLEKLPSEEHRKTRNNLPKETTYILLKWLNEHLNHPYPNSFEKNQLMMLTGLKQQQLSNWFINARRRKIKMLKQQQQIHLNDEE